MSENRQLPAASGEVRWRDPSVEPPPRGSKLLVLTSGGVAVFGEWTDRSNFTHWSPLPKRPNTQVNTSHTTDAKSASRKTGDSRYAVWRLTPPGNWCCYDRVAQQVLHKGDREECLRYAARAGQQLEMPVFAGG